MPDTKKENNTIKYIIFSMIILILIGLNLAVFINHHAPKRRVVDESNSFKPQNLEREIASENTIEKSMQNNISQMGERNRCQTYIGEFLTWIEEENYDKAYNVLNSDFKTNYFPSVEDFKGYVLSHFPKNSVLVYEDIIRQSPYYIVTVTMDDDMDSNFTTLKQRFVVKENGNNDFEISFQVQ